MPKAEFTCSVAVQALPEQTDAGKGVWAYSYTITIQNTGNIAAQLIGRHWRIVDSRGREQRVDGLAVVGHQPLLAPGEKFEYSSWAQIETAHGSMAGRYLCVTEAAEVFYAEVPEFALADSAGLH